MSMSLIIEEKDFLLSFLQQQQFICDGKIIRFSCLGLLNKAERIERENECTWGVRGWKVKPKKLVKYQQFFSLWPPSSTSIYTHSPISFKVKQMNSNSRLTKKRMYKKNKKWRGDIFKDYLKIHKIFHRLDKFFSFPSMTFVCMSIDPYNFSFCEWKYM